MGARATRARLDGRTNGAVQNSDHILDEAGDDLDTELEDVDGLTAEQRAGLVAKGQTAIAEGVGEVREKVGDTLTDVRDDAAFVRSSSDVVAQRAWDEVDEELGLAERLGEDSQVYAAIEGTFTKVVSASVTLIVGIYVFAQISNTMPTPENESLANATSTVKSTTGQAFTLGAVAVIVLVASVILGLVGGFGGRRGARR
jgi:hypothetical protein